MSLANDLIERSRMFETRADRAIDPISKQHYREMAAHYRSVAMEHRHVGPSLVPDQDDDIQIVTTEEA